MVMKPLTEPLELKIMRHLNSRMKFSEKERVNYWNFEKGFEGEVRFESYLKNLSNDRLLLYDVLLECSNSHFQNDSILISPNTNYLFEVKNYEGDYIIEDGIWYSISGTEIKNPVTQLSRNESLLRRLMHEQGFNLPLKSYVVFVNPDFHLYQAPNNLPIIYPTQLNRFFRKLDSHNGLLKTKHHKFAEMLFSRHITNSPYSNFPKYDFETLNKGITCSSCYSMIHTFTDRAVVCGKCGCVEHFNLAVIRSVEEFRLLFPERKITTSMIYEWCGKTKYSEGIRIILTNNYKKTGQGRSTYYVDY